MGFKRTSEGRVFFESPEESQKTIGGKDLQLVGLLKALNTRLNDVQRERERLARELTENRRFIKELETRSSRNEQAYIELEQKIADRQNETSKKSERAEKVAKDTLKELLETREELGTLKKKTQLSEKSFSALKSQINQRKQTEDVLRRHQVALEKLHREQGEKMVNSVAAYVALTKRVNEAESKFDTLDNKLAESDARQSEINKKVERVSEDRNRMIRKVDRIEEAVLETRDALNAKAMVVLADQKAGAAHPNADPLMLENRSGAANSFTWFSKSGAVTFLCGALLTSLLIVGLTTPVSIKMPSLSAVDLSFLTSSPKTESAPLAERSVAPVQAVPAVREASEDVGETVEALPEDFSAIYEPPAVPEEINDIDVLDIQNEDEILALLEENPRAAGKTMNAVEPGLNTATEEFENEVETISSATLEKQPDIKAVVLEPRPGLENRIRPDTGLPEEIRKIEEQAFALVPEAQHDLAAIYTAGHAGVQQNFDRAALWFREAAEAGVANAAYNLGVLYQQGLGVTRNLSEAISWYQAAAKLNHPEAQYNLGIAYIEGIGLPYNPEKAAGYFEGAANQGIMEAAYNLGLIYENGLLGQARPDEALAWYKKAADKGSPEAQAALGQLAKTLDMKVEDINQLVETMTGGASVQKPQSASPATQNKAEPIKPQPLAASDVGVSKAEQGANDQRALIASIQANLIEMGLYPGPADGINGPLTADAVRAYQLFHDFEVDGQVSEDLLEYMEADIR